MRALQIGLMVLGLMGIALVGVTSPAFPINKVVIGVLDFEASGAVVGESPEERKRILMKELQRNTQVKLVDIHESCGLSDLKRHGYEQAERYKMNYQLDMILHVSSVEKGIGSWPVGAHCYLSLINLYTKKVKEVSVETSSSGMPMVFLFRGISKKLLVSGDLKRVLTAKKEALEKKEVTVLRDVKEGPKEIEGKKDVLWKKETAVLRELKKSPEDMEVFLIQNGPKLIAQGEYNRVLELIRDIPERRRYAQIQTLACFGNLKGWVSRRDRICKLSWWNLRQRLINSGDNEATPMLVVFLRDKDPYVRLYAAELLGHIGDKRALKDLRKAGENDENHKVRKYAKWAYEQISGEEF